MQDIRAQLQGEPELCERVLGVLGEPTPQPEHVAIRTDSESVDLALARALALAASGTLAKVELTDEHNNG